MVKSNILPLVDAVVKGRSPIKLMCLFCTVKFSDTRNQKGIPIWFCPQWLRRPYQHIKSEDPIVETEDDILAEVSKEAK